MDHKNDITIQELHERFDSWEYNYPTEEIILIDSDEKPLTKIKINDLINIWFDIEDTK